VNYVIQMVRESQDLKLQRYIVQLVTYFLSFLLSFFQFEKKRKESESVCFLTVVGGLLL